MNPAQENCRESLQHAIDAQIKELEESIQTQIESLEEFVQTQMRSLEVLKLRRNALQPISSLPPEIFAVIFYSLCLPGIPSLGGNPSRNRARLRISHVCHQWREIALNQPQLWSHINFNTVSFAGATKIIDRASSVPLYMEGQYDDDRFGPFLHQLQEFLPHTRHLSIGAGSFGTMYRGLEDALISPAPSLEYLSLFCRRDVNRVVADEQPINPDIQVIDTLFDGSTPRLSCLILRNCNISWKYSLFKGLKNLEIITPNEMARPTLAVWLDTLDEIPQLKSLTLHLASPVAVHFPVDVERTVTLPSLTHLDISASLRDCALASAHLVLPALTSLCLIPTDYLTRGSGVQPFLPYIVQHVNGPQDIRPLQSVLIRNRWNVTNLGNELELLAWPVPDIGTFVHNPPAFLGATLQTRVKLSLRSSGDVCMIEILEILMAALPLDGILTLAAVDLNLLQTLSRGNPSLDVAMQPFWLRLSPNWPLLRRVQLAPVAFRGLIRALLEDPKDPLLPSLTELALAETTLDAHQTLSLREALMKRAEKGVPLKTLDLRMCSRDPYNLVAVQLLSEAAVDILRPLDFLGPEDTEESRKAGYTLFAKMLTMWAPFLPYPYYSGDDDSEFEESEDGFDDDDEYDEYDERGNDGGRDGEAENDNLDDDEDDEDYVPDDD